jgi:hypothetical protein
MAKKTDAPLPTPASEPQREPEVEPTVALPADSAAAIYRDKSGKPFATTLTEGAANFGAVTAAARAIVTDESKNEPKDAA